MITLTTLRLTCRQLTANDWPFFLLLQQNAQVMEYIADPRKEDEIRAAFDARLPHWTPGDSHWLCLSVQDKQRTPLGFTGYIHREADCAEVGFIFAPEAQGKGYAAESLRALCDFAFGPGEIRRLTATATAGNTASRQLLERVGFRLEGVLRENYALKGKWHDDWLFGLLRHEYMA